MRLLWKFVSALLMASFVMGATSGAAPVNRHVGLGSTPTQWAHAYGVSHAQTYCQSGNACYGAATLNNTSGPAFLFTVVLFGGGLDTTYTVNLLNGSKLANAMHTLHYTLPADAKFGSVRAERAGPGSSCAILLGSSKELGLRFHRQNQGNFFTVEFYSTNVSNSIQYYKPNDIQTIVVSVGRAPFNGIC